MQLGGIIRFAYGVGGGERVIFDSSVDSKMLEQDFEVRAKPATSEPSPTRQQVLAMTRRLLAERFGLRVRIESEVDDVMVLRLAKSGVFGAGLRPAPEGCITFPLGLNPKDERFAEASERSCFLTHSDERFRGTMTMADFAASLSSWSGSPILDRTELKGTFRIDVRMSRASLAKMSRLPLPVYPPETDAPSFVDAMRDQLGLIARRERQPLPVLVIEHLGPLVEN